MSTNSYLVNLEIFKEYNENLDDAENIRAIFKKKTGHILEELVNEHKFKKDDQIFLCVKNRGEVFIFASFSILGFGSLTSAIKNKNLLTEVIIGCEDLWEEPILLSFMLEKGLSFKKEDFWDFTALRLTLDDCNIFQENLEGYTDKEQCHKVYENHLKSIEAIDWIENTLVLGLLKHQEGFECINQQLKQIIHLKEENESLKKKLNQIEGQEENLGFISKNLKNILDFFQKKEQKAR